MRCLSAACAGVLLLPLLAALASALPAGKKPPTVVQTDLGPIEGVYEPLTDLVAFYGIPFAAPPVGDLRLRPPVAPQHWTKTRNCKEDKYFQICPQFPFLKDDFIGTEDCLYMNIYVPSEAVETTLPVMFWIYGGGYTVGDDQEFGWYRGKNLAASERVIVVEHNYRLGALGFLSLPEFRAETPLNTTGNFALQDQQAALNFTHRNIANFGGDPKRLVIFGESAGAFSVCWHLVSTVSRPWFTAAIMESGTCASAEFFITPKRAETFSKIVVKKMGCDMETGEDMLKCIRSKKADDFFMKKKDWPRNETIPPLAPDMPFGPTIDGSVHGLRGRPIDLIEKNDHAQVPVIMGMNKDEGSIFVFAIPGVVPGVDFPLNTAKLNLTMQHIFNVSTANAILNQYPESRFKDSFEQLNIILRDYFFLCPTKRALGYFDQHGLPAYQYFFDAKLSNWIDYDALGNYHTSELALVFDNEWPPIVHDFDKDEKAISASFRLYWSNMARFGSPNHNLGPDQVVFPQFNATSQLYVHMTQPTRQDAKLVEADCAFWATHYAKYYFD